MTKVARERVVCDKCGKVSLQLMVYSVNYSLGSKESNDELMRHQQKCPFCGYEASLIGPEFNTYTNLLYKITETNNDKDTLDSWSSRTWNVYNCLIVDYMVRSTDRLKSVDSFDITEDEFNSIKKIMESSIPKTDSTIGNEWSFSRHENGQLISEDKCSNIYEVSELGDLANFLYEKVGLKSMYDIKVEKNVPEFVYGIPDDMIKEFKEDNKPRNIFSAFKGGFFGPSYYYFINKKKDVYEFKFGFSSDGRVLSNKWEDPNIHTFEENQDYYDEFSDELYSITKDWNTSYVDNSIMDGTQWNVEFIEEGMKYSGSNAFPDNFRELTLLLNKYFKTDSYINESYDVDVRENRPQIVYGPPKFLNPQTKYNINPEDNEPREVYGPPDYFRNPSKYDIEPEDNNPQRVYGVPRDFNNDESLYIEVSNKNIKYRISLRKIGNDYSLSVIHDDFVKFVQNELEDKPITISALVYDDFISKFDKITSDWIIFYAGDSDTTWSINFNKFNRSETLSGVGGFPPNWNELIDLLIECEKYYNSK